LDLKIRTAVYNANNQLTQWGSTAMTYDQQILDGKQPEYPPHRRDATFKKAPRSRPAAAENLSLPLLPPE
jgi:hypothetical protein